MIESLECEALEAMLGRLRGDLAEAEARLTAAKARAVEGVIAGNDSAEDTRAVAEARDRVETLDTAIKQKSAELDAAKGEALRHAVEQRAGAVEDALAEHRRTYAAARAEFAALADQLTAVAARVVMTYGTLGDCWSESLILAERFGVALPTRPPDAPPAANPECAKALQQLRGLHLGSAFALPERMSRLPYRAPGWDVQKTLSRVRDTRTGQLLAAAGLGLLNPDAWESARERAANERRDAGDAVRRDEARHHEDWLRERLKDGPVLKDVLERQALKGGLRWRRDQNHPGASILEAFDQVHAMGYEEREHSPTSDAPVWWALGRVDEGRFVPLQAARPGVLRGLR